ncbi:MAG: hypothetical protein AABY92_10215, partial [Thermodesulfobacteriota bacterium]
RGEEGELMDRDEIDLLRTYARRSAQMGNGHVSNLLNRYSVYDYTLMADEIARTARGRLLDWGCGYGHMSYLLRRRGFDVTGLTAPGLGKDLSKRIAMIPLKRLANLL